MLQRSENNSSSGCKADFESHLRLGRFVVGGWIRDASEVPDNRLIGKPELKVGHERGEYDLFC